MTLNCEETVDSGSNIVVKYVYTLGASGERIKVEELDRTVEYTYDELYRLTSETITEGKKVTTYTYAYDSVSNRTLKTVNGVETVYTYNSLNQLISENDTTYEYDNAGNLVRVIGTGKSALYEYNSENKLVKATVQQGNTVVVEEYTYDYEGNRTSKATTTSDGNVEYIQYLNDNSSLTNVLVEIGSENVYYTVGADLISQEVDGEVYVYLYDGHGTVRALANSKGEITDTYSYDAFGNLLKSTGSTANSYLYCGEQYDETTGLYYLRARYMDTSIGRFISMDTYQGSTVDPISLHKYLYANSNPVMYTDPSGYMVDFVFAGAINAELHKSDVIQSSAALATGMKIISSLMMSLAVTNHVYEQIEYLLNSIDDVASGATTSAEVNAAVKDGAVESSTDGAGAGSGGTAPDPNNGNKNNKKPSQKKGDYKKRSSEEIENKYNLKEEQFHRQVKKSILSTVKNELSSVSKEIRIFIKKCGNPDILLDKNGFIALQSPSTKDIVIIGVNICEFIKNNWSN